MYKIKLITAYVNKSWTTPNSGNELAPFEILITELLNNYIECYIDYYEIGTHTVYQVKLKDIPGITEQLPSVFLSDYLEFTITDPIVPMSEGMINISKPKAITYKNLWDAGYSVERGGPISNVGKDRDLIITRKSLTAKPISQTNDKVLFLVNDKVVFPEITGENAIVREGFIRLNEKGRQDLSIIDFTALGGFTLLPITESNTSLYRENKTESIVVYNGEANTFNGKIVFLVTNGVLRYLNDGYSAVNDSTISIALNHLDMVKLAEDPSLERHWITVSNINQNGWDLSTLDALSYITHGNSALLLLDVTNFALHEEYLARTGLIDQYTLYRAPKGIMYSSDGSICNYNITAYDYDAIAMTVSPLRSATQYSDTVHYGDVTHIVRKQSPQVPRLNTIKVVDYYTL